MIETQECEYYTFLLNGKTGAIEKGASLTHERVCEMAGMEPGAWIFYSMRLSSGMLPEKASVKIINDYTVITCVGRQLSPEKPRVANRGDVFEITIADGHSFECVVGFSGEDSLTLVDQDDGLAWRYERYLIDNDQYDKYTIERWNQFHEAGLLARWEKQDG